MIAALRLELRTPERGVRLAHPPHLDAERLGSPGTLDDGELAREVVRGVQQREGLIVADASMTRHGILEKDGSSRASSS